MENHFKHARHLGASDLQAIEKQAFEQALAGVETAARLDPDGVETVLRPTWSAFHDLLQLLIANGGAPMQIVGHAGQGQRSTRYDQRTDLPEMLAALETVSFLTKHIEARPIQLLPRGFRRNT